ncbi:hypothetical protein [Actinoallomurus rhizosphaericola]|uniref:hypothetical protein n=1 Tax=Actinoallomurus rhizosphaericola TaxID=2952536 RepID=UPI002093A1D0|nr:hypothetical protein [Actinoallomurus rhizosphaericola]MCO5998407.1 hypothetical protein [Actinoallomurus rhizosphaericola]
MSVRDADLYEELLHRLASLRDGEPLRVVEWGTGRSTLWYTRFLDHLGVPYQWLAIEHHREYFDSSVAPELAARHRAVVTHAEKLAEADTGKFFGDGGILAVGYDFGELLPWVPGREKDRLAPLDDYISLPARLGFACDLAIVDGRKRRRCVLQAADLIGRHGYVILHDAWRIHYQSAWPAFRSGRRFGDEWWIGANRATDFSDVLPWYSFLEHAEGAPLRAGGVKNAWKRAASLTAHRVSARIAAAKIPASRGAKAR